MCRSDEGARGVADGFEPVSVGAQHQGASSNVFFESVARDRYRNRPDTVDQTVRCSVSTTRNVIRRLAILAPTVALPALMLAGCGSAKSAKSATTTTVATTTTTVASETTTVVTTPSSSTTPAGPTTTSATRSATTTATTRPAASGTIQLTDKDDGTTTAVTKATTIVVVLASTYWGFPNPPNAAVLQQIGAVSVVPSPPGTCVPGGGCGTASATYKAVGIGQTKITASRTTCGEGLLCTGTKGMYSVTVLVVG